MIKRGFGELLEYLKKNSWWESVVIQRIADLRKQKGLSRDEDLEAAGPGLRTKFRRALTTQGEKKQIANPYELAEILGVLGFKADDFFSMRYPLLSQWPAGSRVEVLVGGHTATKLKYVEQDVRLAAVGLGDALAFADLIRFVQHEVEVNVRFGLHAIPAELDYLKADEQLKEFLRKDHGVGAVVSVGSDVSNTASAALAKRILDDAKLPVTFRWSKASAARLKGKKIPPVLSDTTAVDFSKEGLWWSHLPGNRDANAPFPRDRDGDCTTRVRRDCGMILIDVRERPWKIVLAGHGSDGTQAAVHALREQGLIHTELAIKKNESLGENRACLVVETRRDGDKLQRRVFNEKSNELDDWKIVS